MTGLFLFLHAVAPLLFFTDLTRNPYAAQGLLLQAGVLAALIIDLVASLRRGAWFRQPTPLDLPAAAFGLVALVSWGVSWRAHGALRPSILHEGIRNQLFLFCTLLLPFFFAARLDAARRARFRRTILAVGAVAAVYGLLQYAGVEGIWDKALNPYNGRPVSTFGNPNFLSSYLVMLMPWTLLEYGEAKPGARSAWGGLLLLYGAALIATMTRSSWIGAFVSVGVFLAAVPPVGKDRVKGLAVLGAVLAVMVLFWPGSPLVQGSQGPVGRMWELARGVAGKAVYGSWHQRLLIWSCARDMFRERPFLGKGWGCFELFYPFYQGAYLLDPVFQGFRTHANNAHNVLLEVASQTGLAGLSVALWGLVFAAKLLFRRGAGLPEKERALAWAGAAAAAGMLADNFFGNVSLFFAVPGFLFAWTAGGLAAQLSTENPREVSLRRPGPAAAACLSALLAAGGILWSYRAWRGEVDFFEGYKRLHRNDVAGAIRFLESSRGWRRFEVNNAYELANLYLRQGRAAGQGGMTEEARASFEKAVAAYDDALAANAGYDEIHFNRASALLALGRPGDALPSLRASLLINPAFEEAHRVLLSLYASAPDPALEEAAAGRAVQYFPRNKEFWAVLGRARLRAGRPAEAMEPFARALGLDVDFRAAAEALRGAAQAAGLPPPPVLAAPDLARAARDLARAQKWPEALAKAEALALLAPECPLAWLMTADLRAEAGFPSEALPAYDRFLAFEPDHRAGRLNKARVLARLGRPAEARLLAEALVREKPDDAEAARLLKGL